MSSTINIVGTGGIIEGNLETANVNVNLDDVLHFDGVDDKIDTNITLSTTFDGAFTVSAWVKLDDGQGTSRRILGSRNSASEDWFQLMVESSGKVSLYYESNNNSTEAMTNSVIFPNGETSWAHIAATVPTSGNIIIYINGVAQSLDGTKDGDMTGITVGDFSTTVDLFIGCRSTNGTPEGFFKGYIADVRLQDSVLTAAEIGVLASKINVDYTLVNSTQPTGWYKLTNNDTSNSGSGGGTPTVTGTTRHYDEFSVDVYDNSTTTDGTFTVTQGKVECLSLSTLSLDGTGDFVKVNDFDLFDGATEGTFALWARPDGISGNKYLATKYDTSAGDREFQLYIDDGIAVWNVQNDKNNFNSAHRAIGATSISADQWVHLCGTFSTTNGQKIYVNGVLDGTASVTIEDAIDNSTSPLMFGANQSSSPTDEFDGSLRNIKSYDYELSAEQVASLYSNTYPQTPEHWWKMDEGTGSTANDVGTGTTANSSSFHGNAALGDENGTLDLDGALTIAANGTLSAPRGNLENKADFENSGTYIHNNGTFIANAGGNRTYFDSGSAGVTFYNFNHSVSADLTFRKACTFENLLTCTSASANVIFDGTDAALTFTFGTTTAAATIDTNGTDAAEKGIKFANNGTNAITITGASSLYPVVCSGKAWHFDNGGSGSKVKLANIDYDPDITTGGAGVTITLTGDCEFDAVTVSGGDTLDLNGQRAELSGTLTLASGSNFDADGMLIIDNISETSSTITNEALCDIIITGGKATGSHDFSADVFRTKFFNGSGEVNFSNANGLTSTNCIVANASDGVDLDGNAASCTNLTIPTGGTLEPNAATITVAGDFTTSGGLLGASCLTLNGSDEFAAQTSATTWGINNAYTIEMWLKTSTDSDMVLFDMDNGSDNANRIVLACNASTNEIKLSAFASDGTETGLFTGNVFGQDFHDGRWHHLAVTNSGSEIKIYADGKLNKQLTATVSRSSDPSMRLFIGKKKNDSEFFNGEIEEVRIFTDVRTEAEIRADMFQGGTLANSGNLSARYSLDEGSGTAVDNSQGTDGRDLVASGTGVWAASGTFDKGTDSTVNMTGADGKMYLGNSGSSFENLGLAPSGGTTTVTKVSHTGLIVFKTLTHNGGTFAQSGNISIEIRGAGTVSAGATLPYICYWGSSTDVPTSNYQYFIANTNTVTFAGNCTFTGYWRTGSNEIVGGAFSHSVRQLVADSGGTFDLRNTTVTMTGTSTSTSLHDPNSTLITGNTTITGHANRTHWTSPAAAGHEIVGNVSNLNFQSGNDLTIIGSITNCIGEGFRQFFHTLDTQQLLDADEAGDDDLRLEKPNLDNANELQTG